MSSRRLSAVAAAAVGAAWSSFISTLPSAPESSCTVVRPGGGTPRSALSPEGAAVRLNDQSILARVEPGDSEGDRNDLHVRRHRDRRWAQRPGGRGVPGPRRRPHPRPREPVQDRRRRHHRGALARCPRVQGDPAVLRDEPAAADDHARPPARALRLQGLPDGPLLPGLPRGRLHQDLRRRRQEELRRDRQVLQEGRRGHAQVGRMARRAGRRARAAPADRAPRTSAPASPPTWPTPSGWPGATAASTSAPSPTSPG